MFDFEKPKIEIVEISEDKKYGRFVVEPLERGYGTTLGNSLRRIMLSSLPGVAVSQIKIDSVLHEFSSIPGVKEDVTEIIMNIKSLAIKNSSSTNEPKTAFIEFEGEGVVTAADIQVDQDIEILNPELPIATLNGGSDCKLYMELTITRGRGYVSADKNKNEDLPIGVIAVDSIYTPVERVNLTVENTRVGQITDFDKLSLDVYTNGTLAPDEAVSLAAKVLSEHLSLFIDLSEKTSGIEVMIEKEDNEKEKGTLSHYRYRHVQNEDTDMIVFVDIERSLNGFYSFLSNSILIALSSMSIVVLLAIFFSKILLKPVKEAYFKQKRFITDASHELKTPLSIINANMDILEMDDEKNQWIDSTKRQVDRMSNTVSDLLFLSKMDEEINKKNTQSLNLKDILENVIYDYQPMIGENFKLNLDLDDFTKDVDLQMIMRLFNTLIENAIKYGTQNELLDISLKKNVFKISNHTHLEDTKNLDDLFGRFVRVDASRNQALGGSGIGLSIAKSIVDHLEGNISAKVEDHIFSITISF